MKHISALYAPDTVNQPWRALHLFNLYRLTITGAVAVIFFFTKTGETPFGADLPRLFSATITVWFIFALLSGFASRLRKPSFRWQVFIAILFDICFISLLMFSSGGISSGLGTLMFITVAVSGILIKGKLSFAFAAVATLSLLSIHSYSILLGLQPTTAGYTQTGLLGLGLFAIALLAHQLAIRIRESEELARQRGEELADLSKVSELIIQQLDTGILVISPDKNIVMQNNAAKRILGIERDATGSMLNEISKDLEDQLHIWEKGNARELPPIQIKPNASEVLASFVNIGGGSAVATVIFLEDTAQMTHQAQQLKLASLGRLTASIAHEIRNPLSAINHASQLLSETGSLDDQEQRLITITREQTKRLDTIVENVLSLSRRQSFSPEHLNVTMWMKNFIKMLISENQLPNNSIKLHIEDDDLAIRFDPSHLEQVMLNVCSNGIRHASKEPVKGSYLDIRCTRNPHTSEIDIDIIDRGPGVSPENRQSLFEPFFTTEPTGTGLGLFIARELSQINQSHLIYIDSHDKGGHFRLSAKQANAYIPDEGNKPT